jgi:peptide/nickel transport system permease protein
LRTLGIKAVRLVIVMLLLTMVSFGAQRLLPGDPAELICFGADTTCPERVRAELKLDEPWIVQYGSWLGDFVRGDVGDYYRSRGGAPIDKVKTGLPTSLLLMLYTQVIALLIAIPLGVLTAYRANSFFDKGVNIGAFLALSIPGFVAAFLLKKYLALDHRIFPESGWVSITEDVGEHFRHAALPVFALVLSQIAVYFRLLRSDMIATLQEDFITMAKAKGLKPGRILFRHALRPSSLTLLTVAGLNVGTLISSAVLIENIFGVPGMGFNIVEGIFSREYPATQSFIAIVGLLFVLINYLIDFLYSVVDPRIRNA